MLALFRAKPGKDILHGSLRLLGNPSFLCFTVQLFFKYTFFRWSGKRGMWINVAMQAYYGRMLAEGGKRSIRAD